MYRGIPVPTRRPTSSPQGATDRFKEIALRFVARGARSQAQLKAFLSRRGASTQCIESIAVRFLELGYLNDAAYAVERARARVKRQPMGRERLEGELLEKGIDPATITWALDQVFAEQSEEELARKLLAKRWGNRKPKAGAQAVGLLRRYGFAEDTIEKLVNEGSGDGERGRR